ncbi:regulatory protein RecX [Microbacterium sp. 22242]|uniref:regulatory protein RecX n=1 Tax=Microbacterium sp. 22242 TaxID=3453896 RepID=UPI003F85E49B
MRDGDGASSQDDRLAPVIPLFGARGGSAAGATEAPAEKTSSPAAEWRSTWAEESAAARRGPGPRHPAAGALRPQADVALPERDDGGDEAEHGRTRLRAVGRHSDQAPAAADPLGEAKEVLVRKLRTKQLTSREATDVLRGLGVAADDRDLIVAEFEQRRYLDDVALAEHLVTSGSDRKGQGRVAISRTLAQRGIPREIADEALSRLEDDDAERALDYARSKVAGLRRYDEDTAIRRLVGQLSRRGYGGSVALNAARTAWRETQPGAARGRVRFEDSD